MRSLLVNQPGYSKLLLWIAIVFLATHCSSTNKGGVSSDELRRPLDDIKKGIYFALQNRVLNKSENGRTYFSPYHRVGMNTKLTAYKQSERGQVAITILGDRRPYKVMVVYRVDKLSGSKYSFSRYDKGLAQQYLDKVENYLVSRPEERDIIDDFRPY